MAKNFCCCSCCGLFSTSTPQPSQQLPISSPPPPQNSTAPSSSAGQDPAPTMTDFKIFLQKFNDISQINTVIPLLEELLKVASGEKSDDGGSNSSAASFIQDGQKMLNMLDKRIGKRAVKKNSGENKVEDIEKVCTELLKGSEKIPKVGIALCILGSVLERFINMSDNRKECLDVLKRIVDLSKHIMKLNEQIPEQKEKLDEGVQRIIVGTIMCISQLSKSTIFRFLTATVDKESLNAFRRKIDHLCTDIILLTIIDIGDRVPKIASESQRLYAYQQTVGIEGAKEKVIQLLDLNAQHTISVVVVVHGFGGIGKTTLADAVYAQLDLQFYKHCRVHMEQDCTKNDLMRLQKQILKGLFGDNIELNNCDQGQGKLWLSFKNNPHQPLFLYIDNGLKSTNLEQLLPKGLDNCLPPKSRILITTRNLDETGIFVGKNIERRHYDVNPLPETEARKLLLEKVSEYNDEDNIVKLLKLSGGVPLLLELAGSQLALNKGNTKNIVLEMVNEGKQVKERDISDRMVGFVYDRLLPPVQQVFLDITAFIYSHWFSKHVSSIVGEEEFRALEAASFVKTSEFGRVIVHDIVKARGKKLSDQEGNRITDVNTLSECLNNDEKLKKLRGVYFDRLEEYKQPAIEINCHHLNCMSCSLRVLCYNESQITFREKCQKPFQQLRCLRIAVNVRDLPMEFEKLDHLVYYEGPFMEGMNLYEFPPSLRFMTITDFPENRVAYSKVTPKVTSPSSLVELMLLDFKNMERLPDGVEKLTKLERLTLFNCNELRELPSKLTDLSNLKQLSLIGLEELKELPSNFGQLSNLTTLTVWSSALSALPSNFGQLQTLEELHMSGCYEIAELPSDFGHLKNLKRLNLSGCSQIAELPSDFGQLKTLEELDLSGCYEIAELPSDFGQLKNLKRLHLSGCSKLEKWPLRFGELTQLRRIYLEGCSSKLKDSLPRIQRM